MSSNDPVNLPRVGRRVWSFGYSNHGPLAGPKLNIPPNMGGEIARVSQGLGGDLLHVRWDDGSASAHYADKVFCIGDCRGLDEFIELLAGGRSGVLSLGPQGGFREFTVSAGAAKAGGTIRLSRAWASVWEASIRSRLVSAGLSIETRTASTAPASQAGTVHDLRVVGLVFEFSRTQYLLSRDDKGSLDLLKQVPFGWESLRSAKRAGAVAGEMLRALGDEGTYSTTAKALDALARHGLSEIRLID